MAETATIGSGRIHVLLAENGYEVTDVAPNVLSIRQLDSGVTIQGVIESEIMFFSLTCLTVPDSKITPEIMREMLAADNGISTSHFQLYHLGGGNTAVALTNFCKLQDLARMMKTTSFHASTFCSRTFWPRAIFCGIWNNGKRSNGEKS